MKIGVVFWNTFDCPSDVESTEAKSEYIVSILLWNVVITYYEQYVISDLRHDWIAHKPFGRLIQAPSYSAIRIIYTEGQVLNHDTIFWQCKSVCWRVGSRTHIFHIVPNGADVIFKCYKPKLFHTSGSTN